MAFTATDLTNIEAAIMKLGNGARVVECNIDGDLVQYQRANLKDMLDLRDLIRQELAAAAAPTTYSRVRKAVTTKGY